MGDGSPQCEFTFRGLFSRIIQPAHRLFVYRPFSPFWPFSLPRGRREDSLFALSFSPGRAKESRPGEGGGGRGERGKGEGEKRDSGHCGTISTKVAVATEFKGTEEWRPMQIEAFFSLSH